MRPRVLIISDEIKVVILYLGDGRPLRVLGVQHVPPITLTEVTQIHSYEKRKLTKVALINGVLLIFVLGSR